MAAIAVGPLLASRSDCISSSFLRASQPFVICLLLQTLRYRSLRSASPSTTRQPFSTSGCHGPPQKRQLTQKPPRQLPRPPPPLSHPPRRWRWRAHLPAAPLQSRLLGPRALRPKTLFRQTSHALWNDARTLRWPEVPRCRNLVSLIHHQSLYATPLFPLPISCQLAGPISTL